MINELKKENKEKKLINKTIILGSVSVWALLISLLMTNAHMKDFTQGVSFGLLITSEIILIKLLHEIYK